jgi:hypothetical protein
MADEVILVNAVLDLTTPNREPPDFRRTTVALDYKKVASQQSKAL